jgi:hypothetical protein
VAANGRELDPDDWSFNTEPQEVKSEHGCIRQERLMTLKLTAERYAKRREEMMQRLTQGVRRCSRNRRQSKAWQARCIQINQAHFILHWYTSHRKL